MTADFIRIMFYDEQEKVWVVDMMEVSEKPSTESSAQPDDRNTLNIAASEAPRLS